MLWHAAVKIAYDGRLFTGSQRQPNERSVEDECIRSLRRIGAIKDPQSSHFRVASRTDRGVSALCNVIVFETSFRKEALLKALNSASELVFFHALAEVNSEFFPRKAKVRWYRYYLAVRQGKDIERMEQCAEVFRGSHDFARFCKANGKCAIKNIESIELTSLGNIIVVDIKAREFMRNMVRRIVAALSEVGAGRSSIDDVREALKGNDIKFGLAPAEGLVLMDIDYGFEFEESCPYTLEARAREIRAQKMIELLFYDSIVFRCGLE